MNTAKKTLPIIFGTALKRNEILKVRNSCVGVGVGFLAFNIWLNGTMY